MNISENVTEISNQTATNMQGEEFPFPLSINSGRSVQYNLNVNLALALCQSYGMLLSCLGIVCNGYVLKALWSVPSKTLKSKFFIFNALVADFLTSLCSIFSGTEYIILAFGISNIYIHSCLDLWYAVYSTVVLYYQNIAAIVLACDRLYAILAPLRYYTVRYPRWLLLCILACTWLIPIALLLPAFIWPFIKRLRVQGPGLCSLLYAGHLAWSGSLRYYIIIAVAFIIFSIYMFLFIWIKRIRRKSIALAQTRSTSMKTSLSLTVTYFMIHLSSLAFFLPAPIFGLLRSLKVIRFKGSTGLVIRLLLLLLYFLNPILDPIIVSLRIPAVKEKLSPILLLFTKSTTSQSQ